MYNGKERLEPWQSQHVVQLPLARSLSPVISEHVMYTVYPNKDLMIPFESVSTPRRTQRAELCQFALGADGSTAQCSLIVRAMGQRQAFAMFTQELSYLRNMIHLMSTATDPCYGEELRGMRHLQWLALRGLNCERGWTTPQYPCTCTVL